jgi:hypothetical protein
MASAASAVTARTRARRPSRRPRGGLEPEDGRPDVADGDVEVLDRGVDPVGDLRPLREPGGPLQGEAGGEQPLDHRVVEVAGDALAILEHGHVLQPGVQAGVVDGDPGGAGECDRQLLVGGVEHVGRPLVGQVQVAEDLAPHPDGHPEERAHRRVVRREAVAVGVGGQVGEADRPRVDDEQPEDAVAGGERADGGVLGLAQAGGEELDEAGAASSRTPRAP